MSTTGDLFGNVTINAQRMTAPLFREWADDKPMWFDGYCMLRAIGVRHTDAALATWLSLSKDDRGDLQTRDDFAQFMGVARATTYQWEGRRPVREWAEWLRVMRLRGSKLADVDKAVYDAAVASDGKAADRQLYYKRAGVWEDESRLHVVGADNGPVEYVDVTEGELEAIRQALISQTEGGGAG